MSADPSFFDLAHTVSPDVETSSAEYARRFAGEVGECFLERQKQCVREFLQPFAGERLTVLEVGGGHAQLTGLLLELGFRVLVHGSSEACSERIRPLLKRYPADLGFFVSPLGQIAAPEKSYDLALAFRLLPHVVDAHGLLSDLSRLSRRGVLFDYASSTGFNFLSPYLFQLKRRIEKNTRPYFCHSFSYLKNELLTLGFSQIEQRKQFFLPMGLYRAVGSRKFLESAEGVAQTLGLTAAFGSPAVVFAQKSK